LITDVPIVEGDFHKGSNASVKHFYRKYSGGENFKRFFYKILKKMKKKLLYIVEAPNVLPQTFSVTLPANVKSGQQINVQVPDGRSVLITIPNGFRHPGGKQLRIHLGDMQDFDANLFRIDLDHIKHLKDVGEETFLNKSGTWPGAHEVAGRWWYSPESPALTKEITKGMKQKYRFICIQLGLVWRGKETGHANIVLYDTKNKVVELFEPHGYSPQQADWKKTVVSILKKYNKKMFPKYKFMKPKAYLPKGIQPKIDNFSGACLSICMMYLHSKLLNPDVPSTILAQRIKENGKLFLNRYMKYIENTIKNKNTKHKSKSIKTV